MAWILGVLPTAQIKTHRVALGKAYQFAQLMEAGHLFPPVHVSRNKHGQWVCRDGAHRIAANRMLGRNYMRVRYKLEVKDDSDMHTEQLHTNRPASGASA